MIETNSKLMPKLKFVRDGGYDVVSHFEGVMVDRYPPGVYVPGSAMELFRPRDVGRPAAKMVVTRADDPGVSYTANVSRVGVNQCIVCAPINRGVPDPRFPPGTLVNVRRAVDA